MEKEFVSYEQALALKELGLKGECFGRFYTKPRCKMFGIDEKGRYYQITNTPKRLYTVNEHCVLNGHNVILAPLKSQVFRWFREKKLHNTFPSIIQTRNWATVYRILEWHPGNDSTSITTSDYYDTYEEAENACIDKLIEIAKEQVS
jgi:hypothetical protein